jgi:hypothetical protein
VAFTCGECGASDYHIEVDPRVQDQLLLQHNDHGELEIEITGTTKFVADLGFMNRFASCKACHATQKWNYAFNQTSKT